MGFDAIQTMSVSTFQCLRNSGYQFFVARVWTSNGNYDMTGFQNIKNARDAGMPYVDGYIFPCLSTSCAHAANQVQATVDHLRENGVNFGMLWLDIERFAWPADQNSNRQFIRDMVHQAQSMSVNVGIYTNPSMWSTIVGDGFTEFSNIPLWWANWNGQQNFNGFTPFGGWTAPAIRQYSGDVSGPCGVSMDQNWYP